jgi:hypothetical protein
MVTAISFGPLLREAQLIPQSGVLPGGVDAQQEEPSG